MSLVSLVGHSAAQVQCRAHADHVLIRFEIDSAWALVKGLSYRLIRDPVGWARRGMGRWALINIPGGLPRGCKGRAGEISGNFAGLLWRSSTRSIIPLEVGR